MTNILTLSGVVKEVTERKFAKKDGTEGTNYDVVIEYQNGNYTENLVASTTKSELVLDLQTDGKQTFDIIVKSNYYQGSGRWFTNANILSIS